MKSCAGESHVLGLNGLSFAVSFRGFLTSPRVVAVVCVMVIVEEWWSQCESSVVIW